MIEKALYQYLKAQTPITNKVSDRIYQSHLPQGTSTYPVLTIQMIGNAHDHHLTAAAGVARAVFQIDSWGKTLQSVAELAEAVRNEMSGFMGTMDTVSVHYVVLQNELDLSEPPQDSSQQWMRRKMQQYLVKYTEPVPTF